MTLDDDFDMLIFDLADPLRQLAWMIPEADWFYPGGRIILCGRYVPAVVDLGDMSFPFDKQADLSATLIDPFHDIFSFRPLRRLELQVFCGGEQGAVRISTRVEMPTRPADERLEGWICFDTVNKPLSPEDVEAYRSRGRRVLEWCGWAAVGTVGRNRRPNAGVYDLYPPAQEEPADVPDLRDKEAYDRLRKAAADGIRDYLRAREAVTSQDKAGQGDA